VETQHMNVDYNAYEGWPVQGKVRTVILRGTVAIDQGEARVGKGFGQYIARAPYNQELPDSSSILTPA
jgi:dihydropyrimidinase